MTLPRMDMPVGIVEWEVFVPDNYTVRHLDGNVIAQVTIDRAMVREAERANKEAKARGDLNGGVGVGVGSGIGPGVAGGGGTYRSAPSGRIVISRIEGDQAGLIRGRIVDTSGAVLPGVTVSAVSGGVRRETTTVADGTFVLNGIAPGHRHADHATARVPASANELRARGRCAACRDRDAGRRQGRNDHCLGGSPGGGHRDRVAPRAGLAERRQPAAPGRRRAADPGRRAARWPVAPVPAHRSSSTMRRR